MNQLDLYKWLGTGAGLIGGILVAMNLPQSGWGFVLGILATLAWGKASWMMRDRPLFYSQIIGFSINMLGVWRYLLSP